MHRVASFAARDRAITDGVFRVYATYKDDHASGPPSQEQLEGLESGIRFVFDMIMRWANTVRSQAKM